MDAPMEPLEHDTEENSESDEENITFNDLGEGCEIDFIIRTDPNYPKIKFENYEAQNSFLDIKDEDKVVMSTGAYKYAVEVDITLQYAQFLLEINREEGMIVDTEEKAYSIIREIELNKGKRYFSPNSNLVMHMAIALFVFRSNPISIREIFLNPEHPFMLAQHSSDEIPFLRMLRKDVIPFIADIDFSNHNMNVRIEIMSDVCHHLSTIPNTHQRREQIVKHIFSHLLEYDKTTEYPGNHVLIGYFTTSKKKYGVCPIFLYTMMDYAKMLPSRMKSFTDEYIFAFTEY